MDFFKKFSEFDPWLYFKETCEETFNTEKRSFALTLSRIPSAKSSIIHKTSKTFKSELQNVKEDKDYIVEISSEDEELTNLSSNSEDDTNIIPNTKIEFKRQIKKKETETFKKVEKLFRTKFHTINKQFSMLDINHTEKLDKKSFKTLLDRCGLKIIETDIEILWQSFPNEPIPFSNLVHHFIIPDQFSTLKKIKEKIEEEKEIRQGIRVKRKIEKQPKLLPILEKRSLKPFSLGEEKNSFHLYENKKIHKRLKTINVEDTLETENLLNRSRSIINQNWKELKNEFEKADSSGKTFVPNEKAMEILKSKGITISDDELFDLCKHFSYSNSWSDVDYIRLLKYFNPSKPICNHKPQWKDTNPVLRKIIFKLRDLHFNKPNEVNLLAKDFNNIRSTFKKFDQSKKGYLELSEFKQLINYCQLNVNLDEMYGMQSEYDPELKGVFCYESFIKSMIEKSILE